MDVFDIDWLEFRNASEAVCYACIRYLENHVHDEICSFGIDAEIELGNFYVKANTSRNRTESNERWSPDWDIQFIEDRLPEEINNLLYRDFHKKFEAIDYKDDTELVYLRVSRLFRLSCLEGVQSAFEGLATFKFPRSKDFSVQYMDESGLFLYGIDSIRRTTTTLRKELRAPFPSV